MYKFKRDKFKSSRGGHSRLLDITCEPCGKHVTYYQKDGPGMLKRMYFDRMVDSNTDSKDLKCSNCGRLLGVQMTYDKEQRPAYRLFVGAVNKKVVSAKSVSD